jgi:hypothetical protein
LGEQIRDDSHSEGSFSSAESETSDDKLSNCSQRSSKSNQSERSSSSNKQIAAKEPCEKYEESTSEKPLRDAGNNHEENILKMFNDITSRDNS